MEDVIKDENIDTTVEVVDEPIVETVVEKTFTQDEMNVIIADRIKREKKNAEIEKEEAKRLAKLSVEEQQNALYEKRESDIKKREMQQDVKDVLISQGLDLCFLKHFTSDDIDVVTEGAKELKLNIQREAQKIVEIKLRGKTPSNGNGQVISNNPWKEGQINLTEQGRIYTENPALAKQLMASSK